MNRKAQGLPINLIILVAIGLIILVIAYILVSRSGSGLAGNAANDCVSKGGQCVADSVCSPGYDRVPGDTTKNLCPNTKSGDPQSCCRVIFE